MTGILHISWLWKGRKIRRELFPEKLLFLRLFLDELGDSGRFTGAGETAFYHTTPFRINSLLPECTFGIRIGNPEKINNMFMYN